MAVLELESTISEVKFVLKGLNSRMAIIEKRVSKLHEIIQAEEQRKKADNK